MVVGGGSERAVGELAHCLRGFSLSPVSGLPGPLGELEPGASGGSATVEPAPTPDLEDKARPLLPNPTPLPSALLEGG